MSTTLVHLDDTTMLFTATTTAKSSGDVCVIGDMIGIAKVDIAAAGTGAVYIRGVHSLTKRTNAPWTLGDSVYYATSTGNFSLVETSNVFAGKVYATATTTEATGKVILCGAGNAGATKTL